MTKLFWLTLLLTLLAWSSPALAQVDNQSCLAKQKPNNTQTTIAKKSREHPSRPEIGDKVDISISTKLTGWTKMYLCISDPLSDNWSLKKDYLPSQSLTYVWRTRQGEGGADSNPGLHQIRTIIFKKAGFLSTPELISQSSINLNKPGVPPSPDDTTTDEPPDTGSPPGDDGSRPGGDTSPDPGDSTTPQFGVEAIKGYFANLTNFKSGNIPDVVIKIINLLLSFVAIGAFIALIVGGSQYMTSFGNEEKAATAKRTIVYAVTGVIISIALITIITVINRELKQVVSPTTMTGEDNHA